jgi:hypothetical protein
MGRVRRVGLDPARPESSVDQLNEVLFELDGKVSFGEPLNPNDHDSLVLAGNIVASPAHNGIRSNIEGSWVELEVNTLDYPYDCNHNLYLEQPGGYPTEPVAGEPNCRWFVVGWQHDGTQRTLYEDLRVAASAVKPGAQTPTWETRGAAPFNGNLNRWWFSSHAVLEDEIEFEVQIPHNYKEGTNIEGHVHWVPEAAAAANECVKWGLEYTWANRGNTFPGSTLIYSNATDDTTQTLQAETLVASRHYVSEFTVDVGDAPAVIDGTEPKTASSMLVCRLFRNSSDVDDDYGNEAALLEFDFHYEVDGPGSDGEHSKTADIELGWAGNVSVMYNSEDTALITANSIPLRFYASPFLEVSQNSPLKVTLFFIKATR